MKYVKFGQERDIPGWLRKTPLHGILSDGGSLIAIVSNESIGKLITGELGGAHPVGKLAAIMELHTQDGEYCSHCTYASSCGEERVDWPCSTAIAWGEPE